MSLPPGYGLPELTLARRRLERAAATIDGADCVAAEAAARMTERLGWLSVAPRVVLDLGAGTTRATAALARVFPDSSIVALDVSQALLARAAPGSESIARVVADAHRLPCADASVDLVFANLLLPWVEPDRVLAECVRVLRPGGLALMTTLGPDTLVELRRAWARVDKFIHVHGFVDLHDIGDLAARAGFVEPVVDVDRLTLDYPSVAALVAELRAAGVANSAVGRCPGLVGRGRWAAFEAALAATAATGRVAVSVELVFLQAWAPDRAGPQGVPADGVARIAAESLAEAARRRR